MVRELSGAERRNIREWELVAAFQAYFRSPVADYAALCLRQLVTNESLALVFPTLIWLISPWKGFKIFVVSVFTEWFNTVLKWATQRPRPFWLKPDKSDLSNPDSKLQNIEGAWEGDFSFPSSHAQIISAFVVSLLFEFSLSPFAAAGWILLMVSLSFSRSYLGVHFLSDVVSGMILGIATPSIVHQFQFVENFMQFHLSTQLLLSVLASLAQVAVLMAVRWAYPPVPTEVLDEWEKNAHAAERKLSTKKIRSRQAHRVFYPIFSFGGAFAGVALTHASKNASYLAEVCTVADITSSLPRFGIGMAGMLLIAPFALVVPDEIRKWVEKNKEKVQGVWFRNTFASVMEMTGSVAIGMWVMHWSADVSASYGLSCSTPVSL
ncbi:phosphatidic acid phosphatase type 2/haloperoxidase [Cladochytrium replicatum]|nr:phosphatidic acid phosphatase type 2/haloperoxidase [Cladochytrium replicatum]